MTSGRLRLATGAIHTVHPLEVEFPKGRLSVVTGVSGSGKTTLILESLIPALEAAIEGRRLPEHVRAVEAPGISQVKLIDATPIGINVRSTVATYANVHDELRKIFARTDDARRLGYKAGDFSYNTGKLRCPTCDGTGVISLDVQFLPDVEIPCPACRGARYGRGRGARALRKQRRGALHAAGIDGHGRTHGAEGMPGDETRLAAPAGAGRSGTRLPDTRRRDTVERCVAAKRSG